MAKVHSKFCYHKTRKICQRLEIRQNGENFTNLVTLLSIETDADHVIGCNQTVTMGTMQ